MVLTETQFSEERATVLRMIFDHKALPIQVQTSTANTVQAVVRNIRTDMNDTMKFMSDPAQGDMNETETCMYRSMLNLSMQLQELANW